MEKLKYPARKETMNNQDHKTEAAPPIVSSALVRHQKFENHIFSVSISLVPRLEAYGLYSSVQKCPQTLAWLEDRLEKLLEESLHEVEQEMTKLSVNVGDSLMKSVGHVEYGWEMPNDQAQRPRTKGAENAAET